MRRTGTHSGLKELLMEMRLPTVTFSMLTLLKIASMPHYKAKLFLIPKLYMSLGKPSRLLALLYQHDQIITVLWST